MGPPRGFISDARARTPQWDNKYSDDDVAGTIRGRISRKRVTARQPSRVRIYRRIRCNRAGARRNDTKYPGRWAEGGHYVGEMAATAQRARTTGFQESSEPGSSTCSRFDGVEAHEWLIDGGWTAHEMAQMRILDPRRGIVPQAPGARGRRVGMRSAED